MKKLLIICLALIVFLTSCDLSYFKDWGKTPDTEVGGEESNEEEKEEEKEPELPHSDMVALSDLINRDDIANISCIVTSFWDSTMGEHYRLSDVDEFLDLFLDANADLQCITDVPEVYDLFDEQYEVFRKSQISNDELIYFDFLDRNGEVIVGGTICANGLIALNHYSTNELYISVAPSNTSTADLISFLRESNQ